MGEAQPLPGPGSADRRWGIRLTARTAPWVAGCAAAASLALMVGGLILAYLSLPAGAADLWVSMWIWSVSLALAAFSFLLFPTGRLRSRRWRPAAWFVGAVFALSTAALMAGAAREWARPSASVGQAVSPPVLAVMGLGFLAALVVSGSAIVVRFARSAGEERLQLKWFAAAAVLVVVTFIALIVTNSNSVAAAILNNLALLCLNVAISVAVLKYRLYDIDRIISRTLAYTIVTGLLVGLYTGLVLLATEVLSFSSPVAVAASTLAAAALFHPLRVRVQRAVDRRFNRARYDSQEMVAAFAVRLKDAVDLDAVQADLAGVVQRALEPAHVSMWINNRTMSR